VLAYWQTCCGQRRGFREEYRYQRPQGSVVWVHCTANPQLDGEGNFSGYIGTLTNITARKQAEAELESYRDHLEELVEARTVELRAAIREQEAFSYSVSHDLRSPLRIIDGFSHMLLEDCHDRLDARSRDHLHRVRAASQRMGQIIDALLNLSRMSRRKMRFEAVDISAVARDVLRRLRDAHPHSATRFTVQDAIEITGDAALLRVVMDNLLGNAWKYSRNVPQPRIEVGRTEDPEAAIYVRDNGVGFEMRYADQLFKPFQRLHTAEEFDGTGIGLATVARIIDRHGGRVWASGEEGAGATFFFTLGG